MDKYAGLEREASLADLVFAVYIERRSKFAALMLLRLSRASEMGEKNFIHSDEIYQGSASLKTSPLEWSPLYEEKSTALRFEKKEIKNVPNEPGPAYRFAVQPFLQLARCNTF